MPAGRTETKQDCHFTRLQNLTIVTLYYQKQSLRKLYILQKVCGPTLTEISERWNHRNIGGVARKGQDLVDFGVAHELGETRKRSDFKSTDGQNSVRSKSQIMISKCLKTE